MLIDKETLAMKEAKVIPVNAPSKNDQMTPATYAKFMLIPEYRAMCNTWPDYEIHIEVLIDDDTVGTDYFDEVNKYLNDECTELKSRYTIKRKSTKRKG
jgi:hypothetical protein